MARINKFKKKQLIQFGLEPEQSRRLHLQIMFRHRSCSLKLGDFNAIWRILKENASLSCFGELEAMNIESTESANGNWFHIIATSQDTPPHHLSERLYFPKSIVGWNSLLHSFETHEHKCFSFSLYLPCSMLGHEKTHTLLVIVVCKVR